MLLRTRRQTWPLAVIADVVAVLVFAAIGRANHDESVGAAGVWHTAWPFLVGAGAGLALTAYQRLEPTGLRAGFRVWGGTVVVGLVVRHVAGGGTPIDFVIVAAIVLGAFLVGWRAVYTWRTGSRWLRVLRRR